MSQQRSSTRQRLGALALALGSGLLCVAAAEGVLRIALDPVDFLKPELRRSELLPHVFRPGSGGHDDWGFRNEQVPRHVRLIAIGDSMTYGISAPREGSWPAQLARMRGHGVYILALGGYGPPEYLTLLEEYGAQLSAREVVIGVFLGNDISDSWLALRGLARKADDGRRDGRLFGAQRHWLAQHSMLYQVAKAAMPGLQQRARDRLAGLHEGEPLIELEGAGLLSTLFLPEETLHHLDLEREEIREGLRHAKGLLDELAARCDELGTRCLIALIPTKESVYWELAQERSDEESRRRLGRVVEAETRVRDALRAHLAGRGRELVDLLPPLRAALAEGRVLYTPTLDMHPIDEGYAVFAEAIAEALGEPGSGPQAHPAPGPG